MHRFVRVFLGADMRCQHDGLYTLAKENGLDLDTLKSNEHVIYLNRKQTILKIMSTNNVLTYYRAQGPIDLRVILEIPKTFGTRTKVDYTAAVKSMLEKNLKGKRNG